MAIHIKILELKRKGLTKRWYAKTVKTGEVTTKQLAKEISHGNSVTEADVYGVITALVARMSHHLRDGQTVVLDDFGRFHLTVQSDMVEQKKDFDIKKHIKRVLCKFTPAATRNQFDWKLERPFCEGVDIERWKW